MKELNILLIGDGNIGSIKELSRKVKQSIVGIVDKNIPSKNGIFILMILKKLTLIN